jgi:hypothetical protein
MYTRFSEIQITELQTTTIYNEYLAYCKGKNLKPLEVNVFGRNCVSEARTRNEGTGDISILVQN